MKKTIRKITLLVGCLTLLTVGTLISCTKEGGCECCTVVNGQRTTNCSTSYGVSPADCDKKATPGQMSCRKK
jgi:hypothetical protein